VKPAPLPIDAVVSREDFTRLRGEFDAFRQATTKQIVDQQRQISQLLGMICQLNARLAEVETRTGQPAPVATTALLTVPQFAYAHNYSESAIWSWIYAGKLKSVQVGARGGRQGCGDALRSARRR